MKTLKFRKTPLNLGVLLALALVPLSSYAASGDHVAGVTTTQDAEKPGNWTSNITSNPSGVNHIYEGSTGALLSSSVSSPGSLNSLTINIGSEENQVEVTGNLSGIFIDSVPSSANNQFILNGPLTVNVNQGSYISANIFALNDHASGTASNPFTLTASEININISGNDDANQKEGSVYALYANSGAYSNTTLGNITISVKDSEELSSTGTSTGGIYAIHYNKNNSTLTAGDINIVVSNGFDGKGSYGFHSDMNAGNGSVVTLNSITIKAANYQGVDGYLRGIEKQGNELVHVKGDISILGYNVTEGRITGVFSRGGEAQIDGNVQVYIRNVQDSNPQEDNLTGIWLARSGEVTVNNNVVVTFIADEDTTSTFNQNITGVGIMKVDHVAETVTNTENATVNIGGNVVVQLAGNAEKVGLNNHTVYGAVNNGSDSSINFTNGGQRLLYFGTDTNNGTKAENFSSLNADNQYTTFQGSFSNFDSLVVTSGSVLSISSGQTLGLIGEDDLFYTNSISSGNKVVGFAPVLNFVDFLNGKRESSNTGEGVINGIVSMGGVVSMANGSSMAIQKDAIANLWLLQNEAGATLAVDGTLELTNTAITATIGNSQDNSAYGAAYNKGIIGGDGKLILTAATPADSVSYATYDYSGKSNTTTVKADAAAYVNSGTIAVATLEIGKGFELENSGTIGVTNFSADSATINSTGSLYAKGTMELIGTTLNAEKSLYAGNLQVDGSIINASSSIDVDGSMTVSNSTITVPQSSDTVKLLSVGEANNGKDAIYVKDNLSVSKSTIDTYKPIYAGSLQITENSELSAKGSISVEGSFGVINSTVTTADHVQAANMNVEGSTINALRSIFVEQALNVSGSKLSASNLIQAGSMRVEGSELNASHLLLVNKSMVIADSTVSADKEIHAGTIDVSGSSVIASDLIVADGAMTVTDSRIITSNPISAQHLELKNSSIITKSAYNNFGIMLLDEEAPVTSTSVTTDDFDLQNSIVDLDGAVTANKTMNVSNSTVTASGPIKAQAMVLSDSSTVVSNGELYTGSLKVVDGVLVSGHQSEEVAVKTNTFTLNKGQVYVNYGTFVTLDTARLDGGSFSIGTDSSVAEAQLNPTTTSKSTAVNLNTTFTINEGSKLGLGTQNVLTDAKTVLSYVGLEDTSKSILAVNKSIVTGNNGSISVGYGNATPFPTIGASNYGIATLSADTSSEASSENGLHFGSNSILAVDVSSDSVVPNQSNSSVFTTLDNNSSVVVDKGATVVLYGDLKPGLYNITKGYEIGDQTVNGWNHENDGEILVYVKDGAGLDWTYERGTYLKNDGYDNDYVWINVISHEDVQDVYPDINLPEISNGAFDNCDSGTGEFICGIFRDDQLTQNQKVEISNAAAAIAFTGGVLASSMNDLNQGFGAIYNHLTMDSDTFGANGNLWPWKENNNFWLNVLGNWTQSRHLSATGISSAGYRDSTYGFILGYDHKLANYPVSFGVAFSYLDGNLKSRDLFTRTTNKHQSYGAHIYANYSPNSHVNLIGSLHWLRNNADLNQNLHTSAFQTATASAQTDIFSIGLRAETTIQVGIVSVIPHIEPRYVYGKTHGFDTKVDNKKVWSTKFGGNSLFQIPVGVALRSDFKTESGWNIRPTLDVQVIPQVGSTSQRMKVKSTSGHSDQIFGQYQGKFAAEAKVGLNVDKGRWTFGANYGVGGGTKGRIDHGFNLQARFRW